MTVKGRLATTDK